MCQTTTIEFKQLTGEKTVKFYLGDAKFITFNETVKVINYNKCEYEHSKSSFVGKWFEKLRKSNYF